MSAKKLVHNEKIKSAAQLYNSLISSSLTAGFLTPYAALAFDYYKTDHINMQGHSFLALVVFSLVCFLIAFFALRQKSAILETLEDEK